MKNYPKITNDEVVLVLCETATGVVVDSELKISISEEQEIYQIFLNFETAVSFLEEIVEKNGLRLEGVIYDADQNVLLQKSPYD